MPQDDPQQETLFPTPRAGRTDPEVLEAIMQGVLDLRAAQTALRRAHGQLDGNTDPASLQVRRQIAQALAAIGDPSHLYNQLGLHPGRSGNRQPRR